jgi:hypothetical protein
MRPSYSEKTDRADLDPEYRPLAPGPKCGKLQVIVQLQQLSDLGVAISIDDFGTGFSFLSYVKRLPVRALVCGRHIFGRHFPFRVAELRDARARGGKPRNLSGLGRETARVLQSAGASAIWVAQPVASFQTLSVERYRACTAPLQGRSTPARWLQPDKLCRI